jgi:hypothetical protein
MKFSIASTSEIVARHFNARAGFIESLAYAKTLIRIPSQQLFVLLSRRFL